MQVRTALTLVSLASLWAWPALSIAAEGVVNCEGEYRHHLQGVCGDGESLYWSFTTTMVKTDLRGKRLKQVEVVNHHGDVCLAAGRLYCAVNLGRFNDPEGNADCWVYVYDPTTLKIVSKHPVQQVKHGAGGMAFDGERFLVVGGLPDGVEQNYVYEYDLDLKFVKKHTIRSGWTRLGIQTATFAEDAWWFGCYGGQTLKTDSELKMLGRFNFDCSLGVMEQRGGGLLVASGVSQAGTCTGKIESARADHSLGLIVDRPLTRIGFGSCIKQAQPAPIFKTVLKSRPQVFLYIGDNIYADTDDMKVMRAKYKTLAGNADFQKLRLSCPSLAVWDDHDYGVNDGGSSYSKRDASQVEFLDFWGEAANSPRREQQGIYDAKIIGPVGKRTQFILLDTRYFRGELNKGEKRTGGPYYPLDDKRTPMLGERQWKWLTAQLRKPAELRIVATSIQLLASSAGQETWSNLPHERRRFLALLKSTAAEGVVLISGDRHWSELSALSDGVPYPLYDLTSSSMNQIHPRGTPTMNDHRLAKETYHRENYGMLLVDWDQADPSIVMQVLDVDGKTRIEHSIRLSELAARR